MAHVDDRWHRSDGSRTPEYGRRLRWRVRWRIGPDLHRSRCFERKQDAERFRAQVEVDTAAGDPTDLSRGRVPLRVVADDFLTAMRPPVLTPSTWARYESTVRCHVLPAFGDTPVAQIRPSTVRAWIANIAASGLSASSTIQAAQRLAQILDVAVADDRIRRNPARGLPLPSRPTRPRKRYLTDSELVRLARESRAAEHILLLGYTGLRFGESVALEIRDLDYERGRIHVHRSSTPVAGHLVTGDTKSHRDREVPMPRPLAQMLRQHASGRSGLLFTSPQGDPVRYGNWRRSVWNPAVAAAEVGPLTPHDLRHTAASIAVDSGANIMAVAAMLGHRDPSVTLSIYADLFPEHLDDLTDRVSERLAAALASPARHGVVHLATHAGRAPR